MLIASAPAEAKTGALKTSWIGDGLFVGTCYQPVDRSREQILSDIALMKKAGFKVVRSRLS